jgi:hypothetical protein
MIRLRTKQPRFAGTREGETACRGANLEDHAPPRTEYGAGRNSAVEKFAMRERKQYPVLIACP